MSDCLSSSHTFLVITYSYVSQATHAFLRMLPLCLKCKKKEIQCLVTLHRHLNSINGPTTNDFINHNLIKLVVAVQADFGTRHVFVKHESPRRQQSQTMAKISMSYILTPPHPQGHVMSVKCEQPLDELTVHVWLLYDHPNFKYCTLFISGTELRTDGQTIQTLDAPGGPFRLGA